LCRSPGSSREREPIDEDLGNVPNAWVVVGTGDFNGDGKSDILWRNSNGDLGIWLMNGTQTLSTPVDLGNVPINWTLQGANAN
jgi:FG-GAP repeat